MRFDDDTSTWIRTCPSCNEDVFHKTKVKCTFAEKHKKVCVTCSRSAIGKKNAATDTCPICKQTIGLSKLLLPQHASTHNMTPEQLWLAKHNISPALCRCGCGNKTSWTNWNSGYKDFIIGHNANIYEAYSVEEAEAISKKRSGSLKGKPNWIGGLKKETDERVSKLARKTSATRKALAEQGLLPTWNKGLTKETDKRLADTSAKQKERFANGELSPWAKGLSKETDSRVAAMAEKVAFTHSKSALRDKLDQMKRLNDVEIKSRIEETGTLNVVGINNYVNDLHRAITVLCKHCGKTFTDNLRRLQKGRCFWCHSHGSGLQQQVVNWVASIVGQNEVIINDRSALHGSELDIYVPSKKFAIEFNGLYWHSVLQKSDVYHDNKSKRAGQANISLMHIFEDEWRDKQDIVKSMVKAKLGVLPNTVYARKCDIVELTSVQRKEFFNKNHIDGDTLATVTFGLKDRTSNSVVAALSLRKPFHKRDGVLEVARCCAATETNVVGGVSKLVKAAREHAAKNNFKSLLTYVDTRHGGTGKAYELAGFKLRNSTAVRFWWTDFDRRYNRFKFKADKKNNLTEAQVADAAGVVRIYCCRNNVYEMDVQSSTIMLND